MRAITTTLALMLTCAACNESDDQDPTGQPAPIVDGTERASTWQPWTWNGHAKFPSLYFAAEPDGYMSDAQMAKVSKFGLAILEFRTGQFVDEEAGGQWAGGDLAGMMEAQAQRIKAAYPNGPAVLTYRSGMWAGSMFSRQWDALQDQSLFLPDAQHCAGFISYPMDVDESGFETDLQYCRWDFRKQTARDAYLRTIDAAAKEATDGLFFDNAQSVACDESGHLSALSRAERADLLQASTAMYRDVFKTLADNGKYGVLSTTNGLAAHGPQVPWENDCPETQEAFIEGLKGVPFARNNEFWMWSLGDLASRQIRNTIEESARGIPVIVHQPYFPNDGGCLEGCQLPNGQTKTFTEDEFLEFGMAAFLVSMGPGSYFGFSDMQGDDEGGGWFDVSWRYHPQYDAIVTGAPLGVAEMSDDGMVFTREFERGEIWVDVANGTYEFDLD